MNNPQYDDLRGVVIIGHGHGAANIIEYMNHSNLYRPVGLIAKSKKELGILVYKIPVISIDGQYRQVGIGAVISARTPRLRKKMYQLNSQISHWSFLSFTNYTSYDTIYGEGSVVAPGCYISSNSNLGRHCYLEKQVILGSNVSIGEFSFIDVGTQILDDCHVGELVTIGAGSTIVEGITIGDKAIVMPGSVVIDDVPSNTRVSGNPAAPVLSLRPEIPQGTKESE